MAIVTRSMGVMPYQGGTLALSTYTTAMCRLTSERMVWFYFQNNPNWLLGAVVDISGGIAGGGTPVLTNQQLLTQRSPSPGSLHAVKLNDTTILVTHVVRPGALAYFVYDVNVATGALLEIDSGTYVVPSPLTGTFTAPVQYLADTKLLGHADGLVQLFQKDMGPAANNLYSLKGRWNPTIKKMSWDAAPVSMGIYAGTAHEITARKIPGRQMTLLCVRNAYAVASPLINNGSRSLAIDDTTGNIVMTATELPGNSSPSAAIGNSELVPLPGDNAVMMNRTNGCTFYSINYDNASYRVTATGQFTSIYDDVGRAIIPLTKDYFALLSRPGIAVPAVGTPISVKVIRRFNDSLIEQSDASLTNANQGFRITGVPTTRPSIYSYPEMIDGKIFWWGYDTSSGPKLSWTIAGLNQSV